MKEFRDWIRDFARDNGWTQQVLAAKVGVSQTTVSQWMSGSDKPRPDAVVKLAELSGEGLRLFQIVYGLPMPSNEDGLPERIATIVRQVEQMDEEDQRRVEDYIALVLGSRVRRVKSAKSKNGTPGGNAAGDDAG